jgi:hypothetical protein
MRCKEVADGVRGRAGLDGGSKQRDGGMFVRQLPRDKMKEMKMKLGSHTIINRDRRDINPMRC